MAKDWRQWHRYYDVPDSPLDQRANAVRHHLRRALAEAPDGADGVVRMTVMCAGEGRDVLPVLAERDGSRPVRATLFELDPVLAERARTTAAELRLPGVDVRLADAGTTSSYVDLPRAHVLLACGVFGNVSVDDVRRTVATLPALLAGDGIVIWTRGLANTDRDHSLDIRADLAEHGFTEMSFEPTPDGEFRVGMNRLTRERALNAGEHMFSFV